MFVEAIRKLSPSVQAFIETVKFKDPISDPVTGACTFIVLNEEGWILTAAHVVNLYMQAQQDIAAQEAYDKEVERISALPRLTPKQKIKLLEPFQQKLGKESVLAHTWMTSFGLEDGPTELQFPAVFKTADLAVGRLVGFNKSMVSEYPVFRNPDKRVEIGEPVCRLGFPFTEAPTTFDKKTKKFIVPHIGLSRFPNDGIVTRYLHEPSPFEKNTDPVWWLETSMPGIKGQSGGPIFDVNGHICAVQSHTCSLPLHFTAPNQYLNVGRGAYVNEILALLRYAGVEVRVSD